MSIAILMESLSLQRWHILVANLHFGALNLSRNTVADVPKFLLYVVVGIPIPSRCQQKHPRPLELSYFHYSRVWTQTFQTLQLVVFSGILLRLDIFESGFQKSIIPIWLTSTSPLQIVSTSNCTFFKHNNSASHSEPVGKVNGPDHCLSLIT